MTPTSKWVKRQKRKRLIEDRPNPFTQRARSSSGSTPDSAEQASPSLNGTKRVVDSGRSSIAQMSFGLEAGSLSEPFGQEKTPKNWRKDRVDSSMIQQGMQVTLEQTYPDGKSRTVTGMANYCDGRWINVFQDGDGYGNTPVFRPQITEVTLHDGGEE